MQWSGEQDEELRQCRHDGDSFGIITAKFKNKGWKRSKNSLIGRAARLGLAAPSVLAHVLNRFKPKHIAPRVKKRTLSPRDAVSALTQLRSGPAAATRSPSNKSSETAAGAFLGIALVDLGQEHCRFPDGDPALFCGQPPLENSAYCAKHHAICFIRARPL